MADCYQTILRGIGLPTKIMYIANLCSYEVDPSRIAQHEQSDDNRKTLLTNFILSISEPININTIISSDEQQQLIENNNNNDSTIVSPTYPMSYIIRGILIGSSIFLSSIILIITIYLLYRYRKESFNYWKNFNNKKVNEELSTQIKRNDSEILDSFKDLNNDRKSMKISSTPTFIEELMRKSLDLAKTAEKIADEKEKRIGFKEKIHLDLI
ncbi:unnamed protein product [Rotaria socialis]|uniref:Uncharacterized protein n=1 Tax=Rotaria socialis TaxID=392032 RepID=A0A817Y802_9BILA|nr:unnamed protein product [Rotaria socialis]